jgi:hypothetical protein
MQRALAVLLAAAVLVPVAGASQQRGLAFGRSGGNIRPFRVVVTTDGDVRLTGAASAGRTHLTRVQLGELNRLAATGRFEKLPRTTRCPGALPDVATSFIRVGPTTVSVHGTCVAEFQRLWAALVRAVKLS